MKVLTVLGTRPEIIRLSLIIEKLDRYSDHIIVHTGQNFTKSLSDIFFEQLNVRKPDYVLSTRQQTLGEQLSTMFKELEEIFKKEKPDKLLVLGDTNSGLSSVLARRMGIPVIHMEAGNRCFDWDVPEEVNRHVIDTVSTYNLPYTKRSKENLIKEGMEQNRIFVSGNPIYEVLMNYEEQINKSNVLDNLRVKEKDYFLVTIHRAENVDNSIHLVEILSGLNSIAEKYNKRLICSIHPRTKTKLNTNLKNFQRHELVEFHEPFGFFDFVKLEKHAFCVLTDSGTVQEECCLFHIPTVTVRKTTERPETVECGSNIVSGLDRENIVRSVDVMVNQSANWSCPEGYSDLNVSDKVIKFILGGADFVQG
ncbi:non-hydrolyzing UDP-N-acetylglucosamine 2-epimerase [Halalkalibacter urbisdiaboli]|uniref:non-hydrolyzing UDP-N-acetylglucosamine 2-epimerase n=1 Tax=Halalkalibacter urbisdiaboli TaxID=1960589 RepID=UPI000B42EFC9|nr:UDP-N-acetylglucosamine 2-epimerase (non-hydrolyzing) [Halalkalibacter urbisdiaboli]